MAFIHNTSRLIAYSALKKELAPQADGFSPVRSTGEKNLSV
jgi:hypothetical protein